MRRQQNMSESTIKILDYFSKKYAPKGLDKLTYPQTMRMMAIKLGMRLEN